MEYIEFGDGPNDEQIASIVGEVRAVARQWTDWRLCFRCLDITSLNVTDSESRVREWAQQIVRMVDRCTSGAASDGVSPSAEAVKASGFALCAKHAAPVLHPAAVCVWPNFVDTVGVVLGESPIRISSVAGGFPSGQTYLEVKMLEMAMAVENGADEVDMVMNIGAFIDGEDDVAVGEIGVLRREIGDDVTLKVIIESGVLSSLDAIRRATLLAASAGADFVKTSTGKANAGATPEAAVAICTALRDYAMHTGRKVGFKVAGGVRTREDSALYASIVGRVLGEEWLNPSLFRIGASTLADDLMAAMGL